MSGKLRPNSLFVLFLFAVFSVQAENASQNLGGQLPTDQIHEMYENVEGEAIYLPNSTKTENIPNVQGSSVYIPGEEHEDSIPEVTEDKKSSGIIMPGVMENLENVLTTKDSLDFKTRINQAKWNFSFYYAQDNFNYQNDQNIYQRTYRDSSGSQEGGSIHFGFDRYFSRRFIDLFINAGLGFGVNVGKGVFISGEQSDTEFKLWTLPVDLGLGLSIPVSRFFKLTGMGGASALGLYQTRSDRLPEDDEKYVRQFGYGYYAQAKFQISFSGLMDETAFEMYRDYQITNMLLDVIVRTQDYSSFADPITINGTSYGIGFSFEYL